jgi:TPR repeat protein
MIETVADVLFNVIASLCGLLLLYGAWLCLRYGGSEKEGTRENLAIPDSSKSNPARGKETAVLLVTFAATALMIALAEASAETPFEEAMRDYERGKYSAAHAKLRVAAESGDPQAQEVLGLMYAFGSQLYPGIPLDLRAAAFWLDRAARAGKPVARIAYCAVARKEFPGRAEHVTCVDWVALSGQPARPEMVYRSGGRRSP